MQGFLKYAGWGTMLIAAVCSGVEAAWPDVTVERVDQPAVELVEQTLQSVTTQRHPGKVGYATFWHGDRYVQCRPIRAGGLRCEAAGTRLQPSLEEVLQAQQLGWLSWLGWCLDHDTGNFVLEFAPEQTTNSVALVLVQTLVEAYGVDVNRLQAKTIWGADEPCPPRAGPGQMLAGSVAETPSPPAATTGECFLLSLPSRPPAAMTTADALIAFYGGRTEEAIRDLRARGSNATFIMLDAGLGYLLCVPIADSDGIYCEAQSPKSWPALSALMTRERVEWLRSIGYADPDLTLNYWKNYPAVKWTDSAIAAELLTILHRAYNYTGAAKLAIKTEYRRHTEAN